MINWDPAKDQQDISLEGGYLCASQFDERTVLFRDAERGMETDAADQGCVNSECRYSLRSIFGIY
jgi:hypothetical protein